MQARPGRPDEGLKTWLDERHHTNGYRDRTLDTRLGSLQLRIPKLRQGSYFPAFLEPRKTSEKALVAVIQEAWVSGVSTRRVDDLVQAMGLSGNLRLPRYRGRFVGLGATSRLLLFACLLRRPWASGIPGRNEA
jgi:Transposase, Mutator family